MRLFANANYDFLARRRIAYTLTGVMLLVGLVALVVRGVNYSIEFTGGTLLQVQADEPIDIAAVRAALAERGLDGAEIQTFGGNREFVVRARVGEAAGGAEDIQATTAAAREAFDTAIGPDGYTILRTAAASPRVSGRLREQALLAIVLSFLAVLAYLAVRFEWRFGLAAVGATMHDVLATLAFIAIFRIEISLFVVAAILSIVGYSLNDTIVIFDRVRETLHKSRRDDFGTVLNRSVNETLPRTVLTGGTALGTLVMLAVLGGDVIRPFALVMLFGVVLGTFSSIYVASPVLLAIEKRWPGPRARGVKPGGGGRPAPAGRKTQPVAR